ncbi:TolC family protein [Desulfurobacterium atlanticum]|uniref:Outer membrane protein TolC n=1 Tax=Desulfurobacterium atlanticum TaxID=240169 RepID=A0A238YI57_9BACT|nr:TolC family protein [Desulfurobacterium atlanticum]SNR70760.1 Outer membrane protein TolC [Desulfurobacterium atlanticum]
MRKAFLIALGLVLPANALTLNQLKTVIDKNIQLQQEKKKIESFLLKKKFDEKTLYYPEITFSASASTFYPDIPGGDNWEKNFSAGITAAATLLNFQTKIDTKITDKNIETERLNYKKLLNELYFEATSLLFQLKGAKEKINLKKENVSNAEKILEVAQEKYKNGLVLITDVLKARANLEKAKTDLISAQNDYRKLENSIKYLLNTQDEITPEVELKDDLNVKPLKALIKEGLKNRAEIKIQKIKIETAKLSAELVKSKNRPTVNVSASYARQSDDLSFENEDINAAITLNWRIFDSFKTKYEYLSSEKEVEIAQLELKNIKNSIIKEISDAYSDYETARESLKSAKTYFKFAKKTYERVLKEYELGVSNIVSLISAHTEFINAQEQLLTTKVNYNISYYKLLKSTGGLK